MPSVLQNNAGCFYEMQHKKQKERSLLSERSCDFSSQRKSLGRHLSKHREFQIHSTLAKLRPFYSQWVYVKLHCRPLVWMLSLCTAQKNGTTADNFSCTGSAMLSPMRLCSWLYLIKSFNMDPATLRRQIT